MVNTKKETKNKKASQVRMGLVSGIIIAILIVSFTTPWMPNIQQDKDTKSWHVLWRGPLSDLVTAEGNPGAGIAGILGIWFVNASAAANVNDTYGAWINNSFILSDWCNTSRLGYSYADNFYTELAHTTTFDIVVRVRGNDTVCGDGTNFRAEWLRVNITAGAPLNLADKGMFGNISSNDTTAPFIWMYFFLTAAQGGGTFSLTKDQSCTIQEIRFEAYY